MGTSSSKYSKIKSTLDEVSSRKDVLSQKVSAAASAAPIHIDTDSFKGNLDDVLYDTWNSWINDKTTTVPMLRKHDVNETYFNDIYMSVTAFQPQGIANPNLYDQFDSYGYLDLDTVQVSDVVVQNMTIGDGVVSGTMRGVNQQTADEIENTTEPQSVDKQPFWTLTEDGEVSTDLLHVGTAHWDRDGSVISKCLNYATPTPHMISYLGSDAENGVITSSCIATDSGHTLFFMNSSNSNPYKTSCLSAPPICQMENKT